MGKQFLLSRNLNHRTLVMDAHVEFVGDDLELAGFFLRRASRNKRDPAWYQKASHDFLVFAFPAPMAGFFLKSVFLSNSRSTG